MSLSQILELGTKESLDVGQHRQLSFHEKVWKVAGTQFLIPKNDICARKKCCTKTNLLDNFNYFHT